MTNEYNCPHCGHKNDLKTNNEHEKIVAEKDAIIENLKK